MSNGGERLHALDGLRALAVGLVFMHHTVTGNIAGQALTRHPFAQQAVGSIGSAGVELFYCLSGVVLLRRYLRAGAEFSLTDYAQRRFVRLYPPFVVAWLFAGLVIWLINANPTWWTATSMLPRFGWASFLQEAVLGVGSRTTYNWAWWSLAPEIVFYAAVPLILFGLRRCRDIDRAVAILLLAGTAFSLSCFMLAPKAGHQQTFWMFGQYLVCFCVGTFLARRSLTRLERGISLVAGTGILLLAFANPRINLHVGYALLFMPLVDACLHGSTAASRFFGRHGFVWLGERSYSLFLTHYSVITLSCLAASAMLHRGAAYVLASRFIALPASILVACALFTWVERRFAHGLTTAGRTPARASESMAI
ncbi:MAG TPA: acyltransferase [Burkholderiaceae bacterium]